MLATDPEFCRYLRKMIRHHFRPNPHMEQDLMQEALLHLCQNEPLDPSLDWQSYLRRCRFHLSHYLKRGRSIDSPKRAACRCSFDDLVAGNGDHPNGLDQPDSAPWMDDIIHRDLVRTLLARVRPRERFVLIRICRGYTLTEIAKELGVSVCAASKCSSRIAVQARKLV